MSILYELLASKHMKLIFTLFYLGGEYPALVEFSPFQKVPKKKTKKVDAKNGIIEQGDQLLTLNESVY